MSRFKKAVRTQSRLRMALDGPSGSGKTYTAIRCAFALGKRICIIDTEHGSASKYVGEAPDGTPWDFDVLELTTFGPTEYAAAIKEAGKEGYDVLIVDSLSHAWVGEGGALDLKDRQAAAGGNSYTAWAKITPMQRSMVDSILASPCHVIGTMRSKTAYILEENEKGKQVPRKIGMEPIQREGMEYEFDIYGSMDLANVLTVTKSRCPAVKGKIISCPGPGFMADVVAWLNSGDKAPPAPPPEPEVVIDRASPEQLYRMDTLLLELGISNEQAAIALRRYGVYGDPHEMTTGQAKSILDALEKKKTEKMGAAPAA